MQSKMMSDEHKSAARQRGRPVFPSRVKCLYSRFLLLTLVLCVAAPASSFAGRSALTRVDARAKYGQTALMHAAMRGDLARVKGLLRRGADIHAVDSNGETVLTLAIRPGHLQMVRFLLDHGMRVDEADPYGTPLIHAVQIRDAPMVAFILARGADLEARGREVGNNTAIDWSIQEGDVRIARLLIGHGASLPTWKVNQNFWLINCESQNHYAFAKLLLDRGADVNVHYQNGLSALIDAAKFGHTAMVRLLISRGADLNARMDTGMTALKWAEARGHPDIAGILTGAGGRE